MRRLLRIPALLVVGAILAATAAGASGEVVTIGTRDFGSTVPWCGRNPALRYQCLWLKSEINVPGYINAIEFARSSGSSTGVFNHVGVLLCHTTKTELESTFNNNYAGKTPVTVLWRLRLSLSGTAWIDIGIDAYKFNYNNQDNLLMEIRWGPSSGIDILCWKSRMPCGCVYAASSEAGSGLVFHDTSYIRLHVGTMAGLEPTSLGRVRALFR